MSVSCILQLEIAAQDLAPHTVYLAIASSLPPLPPDRRRSDGRAGDCRTQRFLGTARRDRSAAGAGRPLRSSPPRRPKKLASPNGHNQLPKIPQYKFTDRAVRSQTQIADA
jgi:hypothetical protein